MSKFGSGDAVDVTVLSAFSEGRIVGDDGFA